MNAREAYYALSEGDEGERQQALLKLLAQVEALSGGGVGAGWRAHAGDRQRPADDAESGAVGGFYWVSGRRRTKTVSKVSDYCDNEDCEHGDDDHALMVEHRLPADEYDGIYDRLLSDNQAYGTLALDAMQARVKADIEAGLHD